MDIHILESELRACHPGALLAAPRILEKATASGGALSGSSVAMARGYVVMPRQDLFRRVEPGELGITPTLALPETVYLIARPTDDDIARTRSHPSLGQQPPREEIDRQEREARRLRERCGKLAPGAHAHAVSAEPRRHLRELPVAQVVERHHRGRLALPHQGRRRHAERRGLQACRGPRRAAPVMANLPVVAKWYERPRKETFPWPESRNPPP